MEIASEHAKVHADLVVADHAQRVVLLSMAGPRAAVKGIYAALRSSHTPWLEVLEGPGADRAGLVRGGREYRAEAKPLPSVRGIQLVAWVDDDRAPVGYFYLWSGTSAETALVEALDGDPRIVVPVLPAWGAYLLAVAERTAVDKETVAGEVLDWLVEPLSVYGEEIEGAYTYARDTDAWISVVREGLRSEAIALERTDECD